MDDPILTPVQLAERYGVSVSTVHQWLWKGTAPRSLKIGRHRRFRMSDVLEWERQREDAPAGSAA